MTITTFGSLLALTLSSNSVADHLGNELNFLVLADIHLRTDQNHRMQLTPSKYNPKNDLDRTTFNRMMGSLKEATLPQTNPLIPPFKFILNMGDFIGHEPKDKTNFNRSEFVTKNTQAVMGKFVETFGADTPIITVFGNNDGLEMNYGSKAHPQVSLLSTEIKCEGASAAADEEKLPCILEHNKRYGWGVLQVAPTIVLLVLNTVLNTSYYATRNKDGTEIEEQFAFLEHHLEEAKKKNHKVLVAAHVPLGENTYDGSRYISTTYTQKYLRIFEPYAPWLLGFLVAHSHMFDVSVASLGGLTIGQFFHPGMCTLHGNLPGVTINTVSTTPGQESLKDQMMFRYVKSAESNGPTNLRDYSWKRFSTFTETYKPRCDMGDYKGDMNQCLRDLTIEDVKPNMRLGNRYLEWPLKSPESFYLRITSSHSAQSSSTSLWMKVLLLTVCFSH